MSEKRKDSKGRILKTGESQRKDGMYQYRYKDINGERRCIYDRNLQELRKKEKEIQKQLEEGVSYFDVMIDGYVGFLSVTRNGHPRTHAEYADAFRKLMTRYNEVSDIKIERCTPHVLRHTFCTKCVAARMDVKTVQYLMGHSDASTTLNVYTDNFFENVVSGMELLESSCN